ncbi:hypothetical protein J4227_03105 [Candidatus Woesearchaeota archaeon]|nr:hypothetical protein [Candidatus Woesearchaeota archaeon]
MGFFSRKKEASGKKAKEAGPAGVKASMPESDRIEAGQLQTRIIVEMIGKPKEHMEATFNDLLKKFSDEKDICITKKTISKTKKDGELFSRFAEVEFWAKDLSTLFGIGFDYMPSSVEIIKPEQVVFQVHRLNAYLNELQGKLHHVDMLAKTAQTEKAIVSDNFFKMMANSIMLSLANGPRTAIEIAKFTGISAEVLQNKLASLAEDKKIRKEGDKYALVR